MYEKCLFLGARDGFDTLIDHAPEKLPIVQQSLINFINRSAYTHLTTVYCIFFIILNTQVKT